MQEKIKWVSVGDLGEAFCPDNNSLEPVGDLVGRKLALQFEDGSGMDCQFVDPQRLRWQWPTAGSTGKMGEDSYIATSPRPGIYFVDFVKSAEFGVCVSLVLDFKQSVVTVVEGKLPTREASEEPFLARIAQDKPLTSVGANILRGCIDQPFSEAAAHHAETTELVGKRVQYVYSPTETYEHIYLNPNFYTWHCIKGIEQGLCDTDLCHYRRIAEDLFLFVWREKIVPTLGVVMIDLQKLKTTGKIFGYTGNDFRGVTNFCIGAFATIIHNARSEVR